MGTLLVPEILFKKTNIYNYTPKTNRFRPAILIEYVRLSGDDNRWIFLVSSGYSFYGKQ